MPTPVITTPNSRAGLCPHGLPQAACPICSGGGMSGGARAKMSVTKPTHSHSNEWSFMKCYAVGLAMQAKEARIENAKNAFERQIEFGKQLSKDIQNTASRIQNAILNFQSKLPESLQKPITLFLNFVFKPTVNLLQQIPKLIEKFALFSKDVHSKLLQAGEKLTAIIGDIKNFINRKITDKIKKKAKNIFMFFIANTEGENYGDDETLAIFKSREIKKYFFKFVESITKKDKHANRDTEKLQP